MKYIDLDDKTKIFIKNDILNSQFTCKEIKNKHNIGNKIYKKIKDEFNIKKAVKRNKKYICNENFFENIDTEEKAYWLGFMYADGCIQRTKECYSVKIDLTKNDKEHIEKFKKSLCSNHIIYDYDNYSRLIIISKKMYYDLISKGCVPNKSLILKFPTKEQVPRNLLRHFIRGYFDGDGTINIINRYKTKQARFQLLGTYDFLKGICDFLYQYVKVININKTRNIYVIQISGNKKSKIIFDLLYTNSTVYLNRKHNKYLKHFYS